MRGNKQYSSDLRFPNQPEKWAEKRDINQKNEAAKKKPLPCIAHYFGLLQAEAVITDNNLYR